MCDENIAKKINGITVLNLGDSDIEIAKNLYAKLREGESIADEIIAIEPDNKNGVMAGVMNRMKKAFAN